MTAAERNALFAAIDLLLAMTDPRSDELRDLRLRVSEARHALLAEAFITVNWREP